MVALELKLPESTYAALQQAATQAYLDQLAEIDPLPGLFTDEAQLIDQIEADAMQTRERAVLALLEVDGS